MNNRELDELLKSAQAPERGENYWRNFPGRVTAKLHRQSARAAELPHWKMDPPLIWGLGLAALFIALGLVYRFEPNKKSAAANGELAEARKCFHEIEGLFPNQVQAIVFDKQGPQMILSERANVPDSTPIYLKICGPKGCEEFVTFSGQQVRYNGENCEVLADAEGGVMLVGSHSVWSGNDPGSAVRIEARSLEARL